MGACGHSLWLKYVAFPISTSVNTPFCLPLIFLHRAGLLIVHPRSRLKAGMSGLETPLYAQADCANVCLVFCLYHRLYLRAASLCYFMAWVGFAPGLPRPLRGYIIFALLNEQVYCRVWLVYRFERKRPAGAG